MQLRAADYLQFALTLQVLNKLVFVLYRHQNV